MMDPTKALEHLSEIEGAAEEVLTNKQQLVTFDKRRQNLREAIRSLQRKSVPEKSWICFGSMFVKLPTKSAAKILDKDFSQLETEIRNTQDELKAKVKKLRDLENKEELKAFNLNPLSKEEMRTLEIL